MVAINFLSTATIPDLALNSGNASSFPLPIKNIGNSSEVLSTEKRYDNSHAHEMAYSAQRPDTNSHKRMKRATLKVADIVNGVPTRQNCNLANKLDINLHQIEDATGFKFPSRKKLQDYANSNACRRTLNSRRRFKPENGD